MPRASGAAGALKHAGIRHLDHTLLRPHRWRPWAAVQAKPIALQLGVIEASSENPLRDVEVHQLVHQRMRFREVDLGQRTGLDRAPSAEIAHTLVGPIQ